MFYAWPLVAPLIFRAAGANLVLFLNGERMVTGYWAGLKGEYGTHTHMSLTVKRSVHDELIRKTGEKLL